MSDNILLLDNRDSFTFNLVECFRLMGKQVKVVRNDIAADEALRQAEETNATIVLSPGPGEPQDAGCMVELIGKAKGKVPVFGVCLGHQAIVHEAGGTVERAGETVHGKSWALTHDGQGAFASVPNPFRVGRYHSLCTRKLPERFTVHAWIDDMAMAISDRDAKQFAVQFHPESVLTRAATHCSRQSSTRWTPSRHPAAGAAVCIPCPTR
ncbi:aminodeoxychorismate/anthranilate synthase component II [Sphingomonas piscis]|uniref:anthranilate synthase n=1 Tax=Sphingomonas piscis TaxID=2714943 RepID=A0A6G7YQY2_9SPHN|nr:aminodeoxychorismate/anthranilate synthase component II [Sphingomonas piscis]QIK79158.1 aminodeoxychorismate/anthranilate synthase component II [Sphingomonas piscis]